MSAGEIIVCFVGGGVCVCVCVRGVWMGAWEWGLMVVMVVFGSGVCREGGGRRGGGGGGAR